MGISSAVAGRVVRAAGVPYYVQVADILRESVRTGRWHQGEMIPSEAELGEMFGVSRTAIRQALGELVAEGLLHKEKGRGTFVSRPHVALAVQETRGFYDEMAVQGKAVDTAILQLTQASVPPHIAPQLGVAMGSQVVCLERTRTVAAENLVYVTTYLPLPRFAGLADRDLSRASLYAVLARDYDVHAQAGRRRIEAVKASEKVARQLGVRKGDPTLLVSAVNFDASGEVFEAFEAYYRGDRTAFEVDVATL